MEPKITPELIAYHGLSEEEYQKIIDVMGREPNYTELGIFSVMWSEHCSYKSSKVHLKKLPVDGPQVIHGPGENAGVVDIGDGLAAVFKIESHNHPSFIEPYQGAATGVGGILRDIFTMGARPIASLNSLRFGSPGHSKTGYLIDGVVSGIAGYGNCMGVPTVGGEIYFNDCYNGNILVNAFTLGIVKIDKIFKGSASGPGNPVIYVGSKTGRDGIHGVTMASEEFDDKSEERRPTVQVGDPFTEKLLLEACLEAMKKDYIVGIQDMGGAGLSCASSEMASRAGTGIELDISLIPRREEGMIPYEVMLSESQERMLLVVKKGYEEKIERIFKKWDLDVVVVGEVTTDGIIRVKDNGRVVAELPAKPLANDAPIYTRPSAKPRYLDGLREFRLDDIEEPKEYTDILLRLLGSPNIASKEWVYRQYDHMVRVNTIVLPGSDAAVVRIQGTGKAIAMTVDCNSRYCYLDPYTGGMIAVAEGARNLTCSGAEPLAITDCLNFGNPENPEIMWQLEQSIKGISEACRFLNTPVVGGNVSLYNETQGVAIYPTPTIAMVGLIEDYSLHCTPWFKKEGDIIVLIGKTEEEIGGSEYLKVIHNLEKGIPPKIDLKREKMVHDTCLKAIRAGIIISAHDCSEGGLGVTLAECCISNKERIFGVTVDLDSPMRRDVLLFGESQSRIIVSLDENDFSLLQKIADNKGCSLKLLGRVDSNKLTININGDAIIGIDTKKIAEKWGKISELKCLK